MGIFSNFPYTDFHRLNADWILEQVKQSAASAQEAAADAAGSAATVEEFDDRLTVVETTAGNAVLYTSQSLTNDQKIQARQNIGAAPATMTGAVRYDVTQSLSSDYKLLARNNIGAASADALNDLGAVAVRVDQEQLFADVAKSTARSNIGAASASDLSTLSGTVTSQGTTLAQAVLYTTQYASSQAQSTARSNIGAAAAGDLTRVSDDLESLAAVAVRVNSSQSFTDVQKLQARTNIGAAAVDSVPSGVVMYSATQSLTDGEKSQARANIGASADTAVLYTSQSLNATEKQQARNNIGCPNPKERDDLSQTSVTIATAGSPAWQTHYNLTAEALTSLTVSALGNYSVKDVECTISFNTGATPPTVSLTADLIMPDDFEVNANTHYEINILNNYGLYAAWPIEVTP